MPRVLTITLGTAFLLLASAFPATAADFEVPSEPSSRVDDRAGKMSSSARARLEQKLKSFEEKSTTQIVVSIFPQLPDGAALEDFTHQTAESWGIGRKGTDNGAVLFVFVRDRKLRIEVGYGLEGAIPDATAKNILDAIVSPRLRAGDFNGAMEAGAGALMEAARGEYVAKSTPRKKGGRNPLGTLFLIVWAILFFGGITRNLLRGVTYRRTGRRGYSEPIFTWGGRGGGFGGGGGGGGFSGGGGSFGGGGASGGW